MNLSFSRRSALIGFGALAMTISGCSSNSPKRAGSATTAPGSSSTSTTPPPAAPKPTVRHVPQGNPLTGGRKTTNPVIAVKLENTAAAMPQYGLSAADLVFVEEVEGSLTRLMPIYLTSYPTRIEPVRSARSTDIDILPMFGKPLLVYSGVASQVRPKLRKASIRLESDGTRDPARVAPHNLYFNLAQVAKQPNLSTSKDIGLRFAATDTQMVGAPAAKSFSVQIGGDRFSFSYDGGHYLPSWNARPYTDAGAGGRRVTTDNVLVLRTRSVSDGYLDPAGNPVNKTLSTGSGQLTLYRDGKKLTGTWRRAAPARPFTLVDAHGKGLQLAPGKTWILLQD